MTAKRQYAKRIKEETLIALFQELPFPIHITQEADSYCWQFTYTRRQMKKVLQGEAASLEQAMHEALQTFMHVVLGSHMYFDRFYLKYLTLLTQRTHDGEQKRDPETLSHHNGNLMKEI